MGFEDTASAIDDSYPIHLQAKAISVTPSTTGSSAYNGPRSGHWIVRDTTHGSAIDDTCPTVYQLPTTKYNALGHAQPLNGDVILRLVKATKDEKEMVHQGRELDDLKTGDQDNVKPEWLAEKKKSEPPGFFVPKIDHLGICIKGKDGKKEVVKAPQVALIPTIAENQRRVKQNHEPVEDQPPKSSPPPSVKPANAASVCSHGIKQNKQGVRITSKNGEEVFTYLPAFQVVSDSPLRTPSATKARKEEEIKAHCVQDDIAVKARRNSNAAKAAQQLRQERSIQAQIDEQRAKDAKIAAEMLMSGALASSKASSAVNSASAKSAKSSAKKSGNNSTGMLNAAYKEPSLPSNKTSAPRSAVAGSAKSMSQRSKVASVASSRTSVTACQQDASVKSASQLREMASHKRSDVEHESHAQRAGSAKYNKIQSKSSRHSASILSWQAKEATLEHSFHDFAPPPATVQSSFSRSVTSPSHSHAPMRHGGHSGHSSAPVQTIFAGEGWISPHPLSRAPSEFEPPPEPAIRVPIHDDEGQQAGARTMTYEEWKKIQDSGTENRTRRNWSRSSSDAPAYQGGRWGFRDMKNVEEIGEAVSEMFHDGRYRSPAVESVQSGRTYEHGLDGAGEANGKVWLRMPWDE